MKNGRILLGLVLLLLLTGCTGHEIENEPSEQVADIVHPVEDEEIESETTELAVKNEPTPEITVTEGTEKEFFDLLEEDPFFRYGADGQHYGYEQDFWDGCSVWCAVQSHEISATASSTLAPQGAYSYEPANLLSSERNHAWVEGVPGDGIGEFVEITANYCVADADYGVDFRSICLVNGYAQSPEQWAANSRVKELKLYFNGEYRTTLLLKDSIQPQYFDLSEFCLHADSGADSVVKLEIASVYPGETYEDTAITGVELEFWTPNH